MSRKLFALFVLSALLFQQISWAQNTQNSSVSAYYSRNPLPYSSQSSDTGSNSSDTDSSYSQASSDSSQSSTTSVEESSSSSQGSSSSCPTVADYFGEISGEGTIMKPYKTEVVFLGVKNVTSWYSEDNSDSQEYETHREILSGVTNEIFYRTEPTCDWRSFVFTSYTSQHNIYTDNTTKVVTADENKSTSEVIYSYGNDTINDDTCIGTSHEWGTNRMTEIPIGAPTKVWDFWDGSLSCSAGLNSRYGYVMNYLYMPNEDGPGFFCTGFERQQFNGDPAHPTVSTGDACMV